ncbi:MAG: hypothetical protein ACJ75H_21815 [Thermoanaerobaculia bacterium]
MDAYKVAARIDESRAIQLSELPFRAGEEVDVIILRREAGGAEKPEAAADHLEHLPPVTRRLVGIARGVSEEDYRRYLEEKYR